MTEVTPAQREALRDWNAGSIGGMAILRGWRAYEEGKPVPTGWPYLAERGWYAAKRYAEQLALVDEVRREIEEEDKNKT